MLRTAIPGFAASDAHTLPVDLEVENAFVQTHERESNCGCDEWVCVHAGGTLVEV